MHPLACKKISVGISARVPFLGAVHDLTDDYHKPAAGRLLGRKDMVLSYYPSDFNARLYGGWRRVETKANAGVASARVECLWLNSWLHGTDRCG